MELLDFRVGQICASTFTLIQERSWLVSTTSHIGYNSQKKTLRLVNVWFVSLGTYFVISLNWTGLDFSSVLGESVISVLFNATEDLSPDVLFSLLKVYLDENSNPRMCNMGLFFPFHPTCSPIFFAQIFRSRELHCSIKGSWFVDRELKGG